MLYELKQGAVEEKIKEQARRARMPLPDTILNKPVLLPGLDFYYHAFLELSSDRAIGMSQGPIYWSSMDTYARRLGIEGFEFERFVILMKHMDGAYMDHMNKKMKK